MNQTFAEAFREQGKLEGRLEGNVEGKQQALVLLLRRKFGRRLMPGHVAKIENTTDPRQLDEWLGKLLDASSIAEVGIPSRK